MSKYYFGEKHIFTSRSSDTDIEISTGPSENLYFLAIKTNSIIGQLAGVTANRITLNATNMTLASVNGSIILDDNAIINGSVLSTGYRQSTSPIINTFPTTLTKGESGCYFIVDGGTGTITLPNDNDLLITASFDFAIITASNITFSLAVAGLFLGIDGLGESTITLSTATGYLYRFLLYNGNYYVYKLR